ncbi:sulfite exporter TauE/SafE family protein [Virgibacillus xinjiangensis]|uniref:Probable membrane transporter protein n=1 Tax=Virgibacillus xinjiangensis TaxID=393090 RepID=A0ABV7CYS3_9BACI
MVFVICLIIGLMTSFVGSLAGLGGGIIFVPSLLILSGYMEAFSWATPQVIVGMSLVAMVFTALSSALSYYKKGRVDVRTGLLLLSGSIPGGILGAWLNQFIETDQFLLFFGILMIIISLLFLFRRATLSRTSNKGRGVRTFWLDGRTYQYKVTFWPAFLLSLFVGTVSGLFGIGGGSIMVPAMILIFGLPAHLATATSMFMILFQSMIGAGTHIALGHIMWQYAVFFIPGAWIGGRLGASLNQRLHGRTLEWILRLLLIVIGIRMILQGVS